MKENEVSNNKIGELKTVPCKCHFYLPLKVKKKVIHALTFIFISLLQKKQSISIIKIQFSYVCYYITQQKQHIVVKVWLAQYVGVRKIKIKSKIK